MLIQNYWILLVLILITKFINIKELSSYNVKWIIFYLIYVLWMFAEWDFGFDCQFFSIEEFIWHLFLIPLFTYLLFPFIYSNTKNWKIIKWIDRIVDSVYNKLKEVSQ